MRRDDLRSVTLKRKVSEEPLAGQNAECVEVRTDARWSSSEEFRCHAVNGAHVRFSKGPEFGVYQGPRVTIVDKLRSAIWAKQHVGGIDIRMRIARFMKDLKRAEEADENGWEGFRSERLSRLQKLGQ